ncbi:MAG: glycosyl hydrolase 53 family protein [Thermofilum sp.]
MRRRATLYLLAAAVLLTTALLATLLGGGREKSAFEESAGSSPQDALTVMVDHGANCFRLRLFVNPKPRDKWGGFTGNDLDYTIALAKRVKSAGAKLILDLHYSDTWADPQRQEPPAAWRELSFDQLVEQVYVYTREVIARMREEGVLPDIVQVGNEITCGMLWPWGKICDVSNPEEQWSRFTALLKAAIRGVREGAGGEDVKIMLHVHGQGWSTTKWFFTNIERFSVPYDLIGISYYPWWHGPLSSLRENVENAYATFGKKVLVVETAYPYKPVNLNVLPYADAKHAAWSFTPQGQEQFLRDLAEAVNTPGCAGIIWWEPAVATVGDLHPWLGGAAALFDESGRALPALKAFSEVRKARGPDFLLGGDVSSLGEVERLGFTFSG